jgi:ABC-type lipoprotein release transport system permease subunit
MNDLIKDIRFGVRMLASLIPAMRASAIDPAIALRDE